MTLNGGYLHREQLGPASKGQTAWGYLSGKYPKTTPQEWRARLERGEVRLDEQPASETTPLKAGQHLSWQRPPWQEADAPLHFEVIYEDAEVLAVVKPSGLPTLPGGGFQDHTLLALIRAQFAGASPLHRLGRGTSGLVLFARTAGAASQLSTRWPTVEKRYLALAAGLAAHAEYDIRTPIGPVPHPRLGEVYAASQSGKPSRSVARVLERRTTSETTLFEVDIHTGRPHQIRIHLASIGYPLHGDPLYAAGGLPLPELPGLPGDGGYHLHAHELRFIHPVSGKRMELIAPPPELLELDPVE
ncbi:RluA family pseudouridine synthase [Deinococcus sp.]|uniref:RluA family pseudouridine synthase n=1 Tax=Deinococcus sp. TaxID=47478 RepID=UPI003B5BA6F9